MKPKIITLKQVKAGAELPAPIYVSKSYVILSKEDVVLAADTLQNIKNQSGYYDDCAVEVRQHDLHMNDNTKVTKPGKPTLRPGLEPILDGLTELETKALAAAWKSSRSNGHDFGFSDDVKVAGCNAQQNGALMTNLMTKGLMSSCEDMPGVRQIWFEGFGSHDNSEVDKYATAQQVKAWLKWKGVTL